MRAQAQARGDLLIPIVKGWCTEFGVELASTGIQVHGGTGFIEETGAAQWLRDVRITAIYEGTTGIQANDLLGRKLARDKGAAMMSAAGADRAGTRERRRLRRSGDGRVEAALAGVDQLREATVTLLAPGRSGPDRALAVAVPYLMMCGFVLGGWLMARAARLVSAGAAAGQEFKAAKLATARAYVGQLLPRALELSADRAERLGQHCRRRCSADLISVPAFAAAAAAARSMSA